VLATPRQERVEQEGYLGPTHRKGKSSERL